MDAAPDPSLAPGFGCVTRAWAAHERELRAFLRHALRDECAADDVLQDTFVKAMRAGRDFCSLDDPRAWLFRVARNTLTDRLRLARPHDRLDHHADTLAQPEPEQPPAVDALAGCLERVLGELALADAAILRACDLDGLTQREFAERQGLSLAATKSRLLRARQRLRERLVTACQVRFDPGGCVCGHVPRPAEPDRAAPAG
jgi:RNA polymerase sigma-70 factor (ECF subfamily)